jgi:hypothetical protein
MIRILFNLTMAAGFVAIGLLWRLDTVRSGQAAAEALRLAEQQALEDDAAAKTAETQRKVDELVAQYKHAKDSTGTATRVKMPDLVELKRPGVVTFAELESMPRSIKKKGTQVPAHLKELDGKRLTLTGFQLVLFAEEKVDEVVIAKNPWDVCCLGQPPTLFDCVKVTLRTGTAVGRSQFRIASFSGVLHVAPKYETSGDQTYITELYTMTDAVEAPSTAGKATTIEGYRSFAAYYFSALPLLVVAAVGGNLLLLRRREAPADEHGDIQFSTRKFSIEERP